MCLYMHTCVRMCGTGWHHSGQTQKRNKMNGTFLTHTFPQLLCWKRSEYRFKHLIVNTISYLTIPVTSIPLVRGFSAAGRVVNRLHTPFSPEHVDMLAFLHKNLVTRCMYVGSSKNKCHCYLRYALV